MVVSKKSNIKEAKFQLGHTKPDPKFNHKDVNNIYNELKKPYDYITLPHERERYTNAFIYQLLVESVLKIEVGKLAIVGSANRIWEISRNSQELEKLKIDIPRVLEALKSNKVSALPSEPNCKFCSFKSVCEPFKNAKIESYPNRPMALSGEVIQVRIVDEQFQELSIRSFANPGGEELKVFGIPIGYSVKPGDSVFLSDHLDFMDAKLIGFSWNSRISIEG
jgi:hypothetical protein